jgi:hypothetical protein
LQPFVDLAARVRTAEEESRRLGFPIKQD